MTRKDAEELLPIIKAYAEGKTIQTLIKGRNCWDDLDDDISFYSDDKYRIKPEPKYRPFKDAEECWQEMQKHKPFGWIKASHGYFLVTGFREKDVSFATKDNWHGYDYLLSDYTFADGTPFGIKEEED